MEDDLSEYTILCLDEDYLFLKEYIESIFTSNKLLIYTKHMNIPDGVYISLRRVPLLIDSPPPFDKLKYTKYKNLFNYNRFPTVNYDIPILSLKSRLAYLNVQHYSENMHIELDNFYLRPNIKVYDYSEDNVKLAGKGIALLYKENLKETHKLREFMNVEKVTDVSFVGRISYRRNELLKKLAMVVKVDCINNIFGDERDMRIGQSRILLNIHMNSNWRIYESLRCDRWRFAGMPIVSEESITTPEGIITCKYDEIVDKILEVLKSLNIRNNSMI